jgi:hypothetical protein
MTNSDQPSNFTVQEYNKMVLEKNEDMHGYERHGCLNRPIITIEIIKDEVNARGKKGRIKTVK